MKPCLSMPGGRLRPTTEEDLNDVVRLLHDKAVRRYLCDNVELPRETVAAMLGRSNHLDPKGLGLWVIECMPAGFAGIAGLEPVSEVVGAAPAMTGGIEPVIALVPKHWGVGLASEALNALIVYACGVLKLSRLVASVDKANTRSHRLMQRCDFTVAGTVPGPADALTLYELPLEDAVAIK